MVLIAEAKFSGKGFDLRFAFFQIGYAKRKCRLSSLDEADPFGWLVHDGVESVIDAGYRFGAMHSGVSTVLTGTASVEHLEANIRSLESPPLSDSDNQRLVELFADSAAPN